ncbi:hypothetical protein ACMFMG_002713 [Clarireedia jacksonii]
MSTTENLSRTPFSGFKRKRAVADDGSDAGCSGYSRTRASITSDFNNDTKAQIREQASPTDICHVIGSRDTTFQDALADGLIDFQEKQTLQNAIALCRTCHTNFDHAYNPSFFFLPTDLDYFLNYERQDQKRRRKLGRRTGTIPVRMCPTAQTYQDHQIHQGIEGAELGGLYTRIVINDFLPQYNGRAAFQPGPSEYGATKSWTGSPMASLQRAVLMLGKLNLHGIPRNIRDALRQLQDAYSEELDINGSDTSSQESTESGELEEIHEEEAGEDEEREVNNDAGRKSNSKDKVCLEENTKGAFSHRDTDSASTTGNDLSRFWRWGPGATSNDAAKFFQRVL